MRNVCSTAFKEGLFKINPPAFSLNLHLAVSCALVSIIQKNIMYWKLQFLVSHYFFFPRALDLKKPIYQDSCVYGHFKPGFSWEVPKELVY